MTLRATSLALIGSLAVAGCGEDSSGEPAGSAGSAGSSAGGAGGSGASGGRAGSGGSVGKSTAAAVATKLGRKANFLIGMGNDLPDDYNWANAGVHTLPVTLYLHYVYLVGLRGAGGWPDWNPDGYFPTIIGGVDDGKGVTPMSSVWSMAARGENRMDVLTDDSFMGPYWAGAKLLFQRYAGELDKPAVVHIEPDFWAFAEQASRGDPSKVPVHLHAECSGLPENLAGMGKCWIKLARTYAPKVVIGFHASAWAAGSATEIGTFLKAVGGDETDVIVIDMLDRDAGCFEAGTLPECQRGGKFYWDETNRTSPNFHEHLAWAKSVADILGKPILWWQLPFGVPSDTPGGTPGHFRDNRVHYLFSHVQEFVDAGGLGACFGTGAGDQTYITSDGGQFRDAVTGYYKSPVSLP